MLTLKKEIHELQIVVEEPMTPLETCALKSSKLIEIKNQLQL